MHTLQTLQRVMLQLGNVAVGNLEAVEVLTQVMWAFEFLSSLF